jgi:hypothetical protein
LIGPATPRARRAFDDDVADHGLTGAFHRCEIMSSRATKPAVGRAAVAARLRDLRPVVIEEELELDALGSVFTARDLDALQAVAGGDFADHWWSTLRTNATDTYNRYAAAYQNYSSGVRNIAQGNFRQGGSDLVNGTINHGAGALNLLNTVKEAVPPLLPAPSLPKP